MLTKKSPPRPLMRQKAFINLPKGSPQYKKLRDTLRRQNASQNLFININSPFFKSDSNQLVALQKKKSSSSKFYKSEIKCNCSLMEYETLIYGKYSIREALDWISEISDEFYSKVGGIIVAASTKIYNQNSESNEKVFRVPIKWVLPMEAFMDVSNDADKTAAWISECVPPADPKKMGSSRGIYVDVDFAVLRKMHDEVTSNFI